MYLNTCTHGISAFCFLSVKGKENQGMLEQEQPCSCQPWKEFNFTQFLLAKAEFRTKPFFPTQLEKFRVEEKRSKNLEFPCLTTSTLWIKMKWIMFFLSKQFALIIFCNPIMTESGRSSLFKVYEVLQITVLGLMARFSPVYKKRLFPIFVVGCMHILRLQIKQS